tara:strand:+ start:312 stop:1154 length:843 start_codon:yes stop_codon:yes gene_type:complete
MRITTKAVFEWDNETNRYVEVYAEGYDYEGEVSLAHGESFSSEDHSYISEEDRHQHILDSPEHLMEAMHNRSYADPNYVTEAFTGEKVPGVMPTAWDFANKSMEEIMKDMGYTGEEVSEYAQYVPRYDPYKATYAKDIADIGRRGIGLEETEATQLYGLSKSGLGAGLQSVAQQGEQAMYDIFQQGSSLSSAGLGARSNLMKRAKSKAISDAGQQFENMRLQGLEKRYGYETTMAGFDLDRERIDVEEQRGVDESIADYDKVFWNFMTQLRQEHGVDYTD